MESALVHIFVGCLLISWEKGVVLCGTYCERLRDGNKRFVNVCQDNYGSISYEGYTIIVDAAGARNDQSDSCNCSIISGQQFVSVNLFLDVDVNQKVEFIVNGNLYLQKTTKRTNVNITSGSVITFQKVNQHDTPSACLGISKAQKRGLLTVRCKGNQKGHVSISSTAKQEIVTSAPSLPENKSTRPKREEISTHALPGTPTRSMSEKTSILSMPGRKSTVLTHTEIDKSSSALTVLLSSIIGGCVLVAICIIICCVLKRKRRSTNDVTEDSKPACDRRGEHADQPTEGPMAATSRMTCDNNEADSEYAYVDHCDVTASHKCDSTNPTESDVYNHLNEVQPGQHSDNVYSTTHVYNTTKQVSGAIMKHGPTDNQFESDVYNHLNEVRPSPHSDNIYNATNVQSAARRESGAIPVCSQYDSVEIINRQQPVKPDSDYNVLSFP